MWHFLSYCLVAVISFWAGGLRAVYKIQKGMEQRGLYDDFKALVKRYHERQPGPLIL